MEAPPATTTGITLDAYVPHPYQPSKLVRPLTQKEAKHARLDHPNRVYHAHEAILAGGPFTKPYRPYDDPNSLLGRMRQELETGLDSLHVPTFEQFVCDQVETVLDKHDQVPRVCKRKKIEQDDGSKYKEAEMPWHRSHEIYVGKLTRDVYPEDVDGLLIEEVDAAIYDARLAIRFAETQIEHVQTALENILVAVENAADARYGMHPELGAALKEVKESRFAYNKCLCEHVERKGLCPGKDTFDSAAIGAAWCHILAETGHKHHGGASITYEYLHLQRPEVAGFTPRKKKAKQEAAERRILCACVEAAVERMAKANQGVVKAYHDYRKKMGI